MLELAFCSWWLVFLFFSLVWRDREKGKEKKIHMYNPSRKDLTYNPTLLKYLSRFTFRESKTIKYWWYKIVSMHYTWKKFKILWEESSKNWKFENIWRSHFQNLIKFYHQTKYLKVLFCIYGLLFLVHIHILYKNSIYIIYQSVN